MVREESWEEANKTHCNFDCNFFYFYGLYSQDSLYWLLSRFVLLARFIYGPCYRFQLIFSFCLSLHFSLLLSFSFSPSLFRSFSLSLYCFSLYCSSLALFFSFLPNSHYLSRFFLFISIHIWYLHCVSFLFLLMRLLLLPHINCRWKWDMVVTYNHKHMTNEYR